MPGRYWHRLLLIALGNGDSAAAELLDTWSGSADPDDVGEQRPSPQDVVAVRLAFRNVAERLRAGEGVPDDELDALGPYTREDMAAMAEAVMRVIDEAASARAPFSAWPE